MCEPCRIWAGTLLRAVDNDLPPRLRSRFNTHVARCARCRAAYAQTLCISSKLSSQAAQGPLTLGPNFDDFVVRALATAPPPSLLERLRSALLCRWRQWDALPNSFFYQIAAGAVAASALTGLVLLSSLRPGSPSSAAAAASAATSLESAPPAPLESLLQSPHPNAALLWSAPAPVRRAPQIHLRHPAKRAAPGTAPGDRPRGSLPDSLHEG